MQAILIFLSGAAVAKCLLCLREASRNRYLAESGRAPSTRDEARRRLPWLLVEAVVYATCAFCLGGVAYALKEL